MFGKLKDTIKNFVNKLTKKEGEEEKKEIPEEKIENIPQEKKEKEAKKEIQQKKTKFNEKEFEELFYEFELELLECNVALEVIEKIKQKLKSNLIEKNEKMKKIFLETLKEVIFETINIPKIDIFEFKKKPLVILFVGINGSGKTTTIAKIAKKYLDLKKSVVVSASDTFRAASIEQLKKHSEKLGFKVISHNYGSDPASVAFDAIEHAKTKGFDVVLIDSAGRLHSNTNLMKELEKIKRVAKPDYTILVVDALTGNDAVEQGKEFDKIGIDGIIVSKFDVDEKGGIILSLCETLKKPVIFLGIGQGYEDLVPFDATEFLDNLLEV